MNAGGMPKTCKSYEGALRVLCLHKTIRFPPSGERVSNTWVIYLRDWDNYWKR